MSLANEEKLLRRWVERQRPFGRGHSYTPALRSRIVEFVKIAKEAGMNERDCCEAIGVSRQSLAKWRRDVVRAAPKAAESPFETPLELSVEPLSKELVPIEVTPSPVQIGGGLSLVTPRGFRVEGLSLEQAFALVREFL